MAALPLDSERQHFGLQRLVAVVPTRAATSLSGPIASTGHQVRSNDQFGGGLNSYSSAAIATPTSVVQAAKMWVDAGADDRIARLRKVMQASSCGVTPNTPPALLPSVSATLRVGAGGNLTTSNSFSYCADRLGPLGDRVGRHAGDRQLVTTCYVAESNEVSVAEPGTPLSKKTNAVGGSKLTATKRGEEPPGDVRPSRVADGGSVNGVVQVAGAAGSGAAPFTHSTASGFATESSAEKAERRRRRQQRHEENRKTSAAAAATPAHNGASAPPTPLFPGGSDDSSASWHVTPLALLRLPLPAELSSEPPTAGVVAAALPLDGKEPQYNGEGERGPRAVGPTAAPAAIPSMVVVPSPRRPSSRTVGGSTDHSPRKIRNPIVEGLVVTTVSDVASEEVNNRIPAPPPSTRVGTDIAATQTVAAAVPLLSVGEKGAPQRFPSTTMTAAAVVFDGTNTTSHCDGEDRFMAMATPTALSEATTIARPTEMEATSVEAAGDRSSPTLPGATMSSSSPKTDAESLKPDADGDPRPRWGEETKNRKPPFAAVPTPLARRLSRLAEVLSDTTLGAAAGDSFMGHHHNASRCSRDGEAVSDTRKATLASLIRLKAEWGDTSQPKNHSVGIAESAPQRQEEPCTAAAGGPERAVVATLVVVVAEPLPDHLSHAAVDSTARIDGVAPPRESSAALNHGASCIVGQTQQKVPTSVQKKIGGLPSTSVERAPDASRRQVDADILFASPFTGREESAHDEAKCSGGHGVVVPLDPLDRLLRTFAKRRDDGASRDGDGGAQQRRGANVGDDGHGDDDDDVDARRDDVGQRSARREEVCPIGLRKRDITRAWAVMSDGGLDMFPADKTPPQTGDLDARIARRRSRARQAESHWAA